jgi:uncharacterized membrane protein
MLESRTKPLLSKKRHLFKAVSYRVYSSCITFLISFIVTGNCNIGLSIGVLDFTIKIFTYYIHERFWYRLDFGKIIPNLEFRSHASLDKKGNVIKDGDTVKCIFQYTNSYCNAEHQSALYKVILDKYTGISLMHIKDLEWGVGDGNVELTPERRLFLFGEEGPYTNWLRISEGTLCDGVYKHPDFLEVSYKKIMIINGNNSDIRYNEIHQSGNIEIILSEKP